LREKKGSPASFVQVSGGRRNYLLRIKKKRALCNSLLFPLQKEKGKFAKSQKDPRKPITRGRVAHIKTAHKKRNRAGPSGEGRESEVPSAVGVEEKRGGPCHCSVLKRAGIEGLRKERDHKKMKLLTKKGYCRRLCIGKEGR